MKVEKNSKPITCVKDLIDEVSKIEQAQPIYFRGQEYPNEGNGYSKECHLYPSIGKPYEYIGKEHEFDLANERDFLHRFRRYAYMESNRVLGDWEALFLARHHGLPVRLLDWTANPLVALFFAARYRKELTKDAAVWAIVKKKTSKDIDVLSEERKEGDGGDEYYKEFKDLPVEGTKKGYLMERDDIDEIPKPLRIKGIRMLYPCYVSPRMVIQHSFFTIQDDPWCAIDEYDKKGLNYNTKNEKYIDVEKIVMWKVPKDHRFDIVCQLERLGIDNRTVYPDLDGLAKGIWQLEIVRKYKEG